MDEGEKQVLAQSSSGFLSHSQSDVELSLMSQVFRFFGRDLLYGHAANVCSLASAFLCESTFILGTMLWMFCLSTLARCWQICSVHAVVSIHRNVWHIAFQLCHPSPTLILFSSSISIISIHWLLMCECRAYELFGWWKLSLKSKLL